MLLGLKSFEIMSHDNVNFEKQDFENSEEFPVLTKSKSIVFSSVQGDRYIKNKFINFFSECSSKKKRIKKKRKQQSLNVSDASFDSVHSKNYELHDFLGEKFYESS